jgi:hypothetical protein
MEGLLFAFRVYRICHKQNNLFGIGGGFWHSLMLMLLLLPLVSRLVTLSKKMPIRSIISDAMTNHHQQQQPIHISVIVKTAFS